MDEADKMTKALVESLRNTLEDELDCQQVYEVIDVYAEMAMRGEDVSEVLPMVKHHLEMCKDCMEEYDALMRILKANDSP